MTREKQLKEIYKKFEGKYQYYYKEIDGRSILMVGDNIMIGDVLDLIKKNNGDILSNYYLLLMKWKKLLKPIDLQSILCIEYVYKLTK